MNIYNNNLQEDFLSDDQFNAILNLMHTACPVNYLNINADISNKFTTVGAYLATGMSEDTLKEKLESIIVKESVDDNSILFFDSRHVFEIINILSSTCLVLSVNSGIADDEIIKDVISLHMENIAQIISVPLRFKNLKQKISKEINRMQLLDHIIPFESKNRLDIIMDYIWFLPFVSIDALYEEVKLNINENIKSLSETIQP